MTQQTPSSIDSRYQLKSGSELDYILAGKAALIIFTEKPKVPGRDTIKLFISKHIARDQWFIRPYGYDANIGLLEKHPDNTYTIKPLNGALSNNKNYSYYYEGFRNIFIMLQRKELPDFIKLYHLGKCSYCSRTLTDPRSIELGIGPECRKRLAITP